MLQRVIVAGAGMAGLHLALALGRMRDYRVVLLERDPSPADGPPVAAFSSWRRRGVAHFRQSHILHPRILNLYRRRHPALLAELLRAGARELTVEEALPTRLLPQYVRAAGDEGCALLLCRRATLEAVIRAHVARLPAVEIVPSSNVCGVALAGAPRCPRLIGLETEQGGKRATLQGDVIVDASGRFTRFPRWLAASGVQAGEEANLDVGTVYYTRYYRLRPGCAEPAAFGRPVFGRREYLSCCVYPGDNRHFSITLTCDLGDLPLQEQLADPARFHVACTTLAEIAPWVAPERADPVTGVLAMGRFRNYWRTYVPAGKPLVHGFFAIGDALAHTNPAYGAGCSWAAQHAHILAEALEGTADPAERAVLFDRRVREEAYPFYSGMAARDRSTQPQAGASRLSGPLRVRRRLGAIARRTGEAAQAADAGIFLWVMRRKYMVSPSGSWPERLFLLRRLLLFAVRAGWLQRRRPARRILSRPEFLRALSGGAAPPAGNGAAGQGEAMSEA